MNVSGGFRLGPGPHHVGGAIALVLRVCNDNRDPLFVFVPSGRAGGVQITVVAGRGLELKGLAGEPEPGLVAQTRLDPGECHEQTYPLGDWIASGRAGTHQLECRAELEIARESLRAPNTRPKAQRTALVGTVSLTLQAPAS